MRGLIIDGWDMSTLLPCIAVATGDPRRLLRPRRARAAQAGAADMSARRLAAWRCAVLRRTVIHTYKNPAIIIPSLAFPLVFLLAFAGGLSAVSNVPGFTFAAGYTAFQFVFVFLQMAAFGGIFTGYRLAEDYESGFARRLMLGAPRRLGIVVGYVLAGLVRFAVIGVLLWALALLDGDGRQGRRRSTSPGSSALGALINIACSLWTIGLAFRYQSVDIGSFMQTPVFVLLFLAPVYVPLALLTGWLQGRRVDQPDHADHRRRPRVHLRRSDEGALRVRRVARDRRADVDLGDAADAARRSRRALSLSDLLASRPKRQCEARGASVRRGHLDPHSSRNGTDFTRGGENCAGGVQLASLAGDDPGLDNVRLLRHHGMLEVCRKAPQEEEADVIKEVGDDAARAVQRTPDELVAHLPGVVGKRAVRCPGRRVQRVAFNRPGEDAQAVARRALRPADEAGRVGVLVTPRIAPRGALRLRERRLRGHLNVHSRRARLRHQRLPVQQRHAPVRMYDRQLTPERRRNTQRDLGRTLDPPRGHRTCVATVGAPRGSDGTARR